jgi:hypothetical protein
LVHATNPSPCPSQASEHGFAFAEQSRSHAFLRPLNTHPFDASVGSVIHAADRFIASVAITAPAPTLKIPIAI